MTIDLPDALGTPEGDPPAKSSIPKWANSSELDESGGEPPAVNSKPPNRRNFENAVEYFSTLRLSPTFTRRLGSAGRIVSEAEDLVTLAGNTLRSIHELGLPRAGTKPSPSRLAFYQAASDLVDPTSAISVALKMMGSGTPSEGAIAAIRSATDLLSSALSGMIEIFRSEVLPSLPESRLSEAQIIADIASERLRTRQLVSETEAARDAAVNASTSARKAAGATAAGSLASHFADHATEQKASADRLRIGASALLIVISIFAGVVVFRAELTNRADITELAKVAITLPLAALAAYLGREASRHRRAADWSRQLEIQLRTLDAFIAPMSDQEQNRQRVELGRRVFGASDVKEAEKDNSPALISDAATLLSSVANMMRPSAK
ncbi:hypothetical protein ACQP04_35915 [Pseudonocardia halophobica]|uniref:hypothetical protein n=1 Tax=Pseudonocardia halophobica TaxID=29401 RepID=UPI003D90611A